jgi:hypothetical protein
MYTPKVPVPIIPHAWYTVDRAVVRRPVTDVEAWVFWREDVESIIKEWPKRQSEKGYHVRLGQKVFNTLGWHGRGDLADRISGMINTDPFYEDENIPNFLEMADKMWENYWGDMQ